MTCLVLNLKFDSSTYRGLILYVGIYCDRGVFDRYLTDRGVLGTCDLVFQNTPKKSRSKCSVEYTCPIQGRKKFVVARHDDLPLSVFSLPRRYCLFTDNRTEQGGCWNDWQVI